METEDLRAVLSDAGLSPYQVSAYLTVLERGSAAATDVAAASDVPDARIYDVLRALDREGYVETYEQGTLQVRAHDPGAVLADLRDRAERFEAAAAEVEERWQRPEPATEGHDASIVSRFDTVLEAARRAIEAASDQIQLAVTPSQFDDLRDALVDAHAAGVDVRLTVTTDPRTAGKEATVPPREQLAGACTEARHRPLPAPFLAVVDQRTACFAPHPEAADRYGILVEDRTHAFVFYWYFLSGLWEAFETVYDDRPDDPPIEYVDVRQCIREVGPHVAGGAAVHVTVEGQDTTTGDPVTLSGRLTDVRYAGGPGEGVEGGHGHDLAHLAVEATLVVEADGEAHEVGGWGAVLEPVEATRITLERIDDADDDPDPDAGQRA